MNRLDMAPSCPTFYQGNSWSRNAEIMGYLRVRPAIGANLPNIFFREFSPSVFLSGSTGAVCNHVCLVGFMGVPAQIIESIVRWISIFMATLHSFWTRTTKNSQDENVYVDPGVLDVVKINVKMPTPLSRKFFDSPTSNASVALDSVQRPHAPKVGNLVASFVSRNRLPDFFHAQPPFVELIRRFAHGSRYGNRRSGATLAMQGAV